jgi:hypothetical protein
MPSVEPPSPRPIALLDWDNSVREGFSLIPWLEWLADSSVRRALAKELRELVERRKASMEDAWY